MATTLKTQPSFPKYQPIATVLKAVKANIKATQPGVTKLPTIGYIGFAVPEGSKVVIVLDNTGNVVSASTKAAQKWCSTNQTSVEKLISNLATEHGALPRSMTLTLAAYLASGTLTIVDAQLVANDNPSAYWLSVSVLTAMTAGVPAVQTVFNQAVYTEVDFNNPAQFASVAETAGPMLGSPTMWQPSPHSDVPAAIVLRDPYRITVAA